MFDLTDVAERFSSSAASSSSDVHADSLMMQLAVGGVDLSQLQGLGAPEVLDLLDTEGIDVASLDATQISELMEQLADGTSIQSLADLLILAGDRS